MFITFVLLIGLSACYGQLITTESATLTVSTTNDNFAEVVVNSIGHIDPQYGWTVNVQNNQGWHWNINFQNETWKFKSDQTSTLTLKVYSGSQFLSGDRDVIIVFSQNDAKYFTTLLQLDNNPNQVWPACGNSFATGNIEEILNTDDGRNRQQKTMDGSRNVDIEPINNSSKCCQHSSPMILKIINNPIEVTSQYIYTNSLNTGWQSSCEYTEAWLGSDYLDIFIMGQDIGEDLNIWMFELSVEYDTLQQTIAPSFVYDLLHGMRERFVSKIQYVFDCIHGANASTC